MTYSQRKLKLRVCLPFTYCAINLKDTLTRSIILGSTACNSTLPESEANLVSMYIRAMQRFVHFQLSLRLDEIC